MAMTEEMRRKAATAAVSPTRRHRRDWRASRSSGVSGRPSGSTLTARKSTPGTGVAWKGML